MSGYETNTSCPWPDSGNVKVKMSGCQGAGRQALICNSRNYFTSGYEFW